MVERIVHTNNGISWHMYESGQHNQTTLILVAGFPESAYAWRKIAPILAQKYHVLALDLPGQGYSSAPNSGYDTQTTAKRIHDLIKYLSLKKFLYIGHDVGSWVGFTYAHLFADDLLGTVLLDANIPGATLAAQLPLNTESWRNWHFAFNAIPDLPEALLTGKERILIEWFFSKKSYNWREAFSAKDIHEYVYEYQQLGVLRAMLGYYRAVLADFKINELLRDNKITVPVLTVSGEFGSSPDLFQKIKLMAEKVQGVVIEKSGHYIPEERPNELAAQIEKFIQTLPLP